MRRFSSACALAILLVILLGRDLAASDKVIHRLDGPAPLGVPRILPDNHTCLFFEGIFKFRGRLVSLDLETGQTAVFQRVAGAIVHADESANDRKDLTHGEYIDVSLDGKVVLIRHKGPGRQPEDLFRLPDGSPVPPHDREWLALWDCTTGQLLRVLQKPEGDFTLAAKFLPDGKSVAVSCRTYIEEPRLETRTVNGRTRSGVRDRFGYRVDLYSAETGVRSKELGKRDSEARCLAVSSNGEWVFTGGGNGGGGDKDESKMWNVLTGEQVTLSDGPWGRNGFFVRVAMFTPDGRAILTNSYRWWDVERKKWDFAKKNIAGTMFSPDGRCLVAVGERIPVIRDIETGDRVTNMEKLQAHRSIIQRVAFSPDGSLLLTISEDHKMVVWNLKHEKIGWPK